MSDSVLYILLAMIFWDFSCYVIEWLGWKMYFVNSRSVFSYYYPHIYWKKGLDGPRERPNLNVFYNRFWAAYWGVAFVLLLTYILFK